MSEDDSIIELSDTESSESSSDTSVIELISSDSDPEENPRNECMCDSIFVLYFDHSLSDNF